MRFLPLHGLPLLLAGLPVLAQGDLELRAGGQVVADVGSQQAGVPNLPDPGDTLGWTVPADVAPGLFLPSIDVRSGDRGEGITFIEGYRIGVPETAFANGVEPHPLTCHRGPETKPEMVLQGDGWQVWRALVPATEPVRLTPGDQLRVWFTGYYGNCWGVVLHRLDPERTAVVSAHTAAVANLLRLGGPAPLLAALTNWRDAPAKGELTVTVRDDLGTVRGELKQTLEVPAATCSTVPCDVTLDPQHPRGAFFADLTWRSGAAEGAAKLAFGATDSPLAGDLADDSFFGIHKGDTSEWPAIGLKWNRLWDTGHTWYTIEREPGVFDWSVLDQVVANAESHGVKLLYVLAYTPTFYSARPQETHAGHNAEPQDIAVWRRFVHQVVARYRGRMDHFEVWNEPNAGFFTGTPEAYLALLKAAWEEAKAADPEVTVLGISGTGDYLPWMEQVFKLGGLQYMDVVSVHTYTTPNMPEAANVVGRLQATRRLIEQYGGTQPIWNTETGVWVPDRNPDDSLLDAAAILARAPAETRPNWQAGWPYRPIDEHAGAAYVVRHYLLQMAQGVQHLFWYAWYAHMHPMVNADGSPRLHTVALGALIGQLHDARYLRRQELGAESVQLHLFQRGDERVLAAWTTRDEVQRVWFPAGSATVCDPWGNPAAAATERDGVVVELGAMPVYLHGLSDAAVAGARLADAEIVLPPDDAEVLADIGEANVKNRTSPSYHGNRRVYSLADPGDSLGWRLRGLAPGRYEVRLDVRTGSAPPGTNLVASYRLRLIPAEGASRDDALQLAAGTEVEQTHADAAGRGDLFYGQVAPAEALTLREGDLLAVVSSAGWAHVGPLTLRFVEDAPSHPELTVSRPAAEIAVDGTLDDWPAEATTLHLDQKRQVVLGVADPFASISAAEQWSGPQDCSAVVLLAADTAGLLVAVEVTDDVHRPATGAPHDGDAVELFLDLRTGDQLHAPTLGPGVVQLFLVPPAEGMATDGVVRGRTTTGVVAAARRTTEGYVVEARLPWSLGADQAPRVFGFDLAVDDSDTPAGEPVHRQAQLVWRGTADDFQDPTPYGTLRRDGDQP